MPPTGPAPPRISRETRLLLVTALVSVVALWALARVRFPDRPVSPNPLPQVLTQLAPRSPFDEIPALIAELTPRIAARIVSVAVENGRPGAGPGPRHTMAGLRVSEDAAVILLGDLMPAEDAPLLARDPASGVALVRVRPQSVAEPVVWAPRRLDLSRYLVASHTLDEAVSLRPVFVGPLVAVSSEVWDGGIWLLPARTDMAAGELAFSTDGALAGLVVRHHTGPAIVPAQSVLALVDRLMADPPGPPGRLGVEVHPMTSSMLAATGAPFGVVVVHVDPDGPAASRVEATDVIEAIDDGPITSIDAWRARTARLRPGATVALRVRRAGAVQAVTLAARAAEDVPGDASLGLSMRTVAGVGVEVLRVAPGSAAARAGFEPGDVITVFDGLHAPNATQLSRAFSALPKDRPALAAITRARAHQVLTIRRRR